MRVCARAFLSWFRRSVRIAVNNKKKKIIRWCEGMYT